MTRPRTAFTFDCMDSFHLLTLQGKTTPYDFYHALVRKSGKIGLFNAPVWLQFSHQDLLIHVLLEPL
jgi:CxC2 like cysteine cluster associated with KDZ transposases